MSRKAPEPWRNDPEWQAANAIYHEPPGDNPTARCVNRTRAIWVMHDIEVRLLAELDPA